MDTTNVFWQQFAPQLRAIADALEGRVLPAFEHIEREADEAADKALSRMNPQQGRIIELRFFSGLSIEDTAHALGISPATVKRDWAVARAWLYREMARTTHL
ncbi:MAG TPA: ECF-type sigma factor [Terriglobales bacterium]